MINYNAAGPYPSCFKNLSEDDKMNAHNSILYRNISHLVECCNILQPKVVLPFAGAYVIGGSHYQKNKFLGTTTLDHCAEQIRTISSHKVITLREGDTYDLSTHTSDVPYVSIDPFQQEEYINDKLSQIKYPYQNDAPVIKSELNAKVSAAILALSERIIKYKLHVRSCIKIFSAGTCFDIHPGDPAFGVNLFFYLDERLLLRIIERRSHWNNAEIGCHIDVDRNPNVYEVDAHTLMQFFHT